LKIYESGGDPESDSPVVTVCNIVKSILASINRYHAHHNNDNQKKNDENESVQREKEAWEYELFKIICSQSNLESFFSIDTSLDNSIMERFAVVQEQLHQEKVRQVMLIKQLEEEQRKKQQREMEKEIMREREKERERERELEREKEKLKEMEMELERERELKKKQAILKEEEEAAKEREKEREIEKEKEQHKITNNPSLFVISQVIAGSSLSIFIVLIHAVISFSASPTSRPAFFVCCLTNWAIGILRPPVAAFLMGVCACVILNSLTIPRRENGSTSFHSAMSLLSLGNLFGATHIVT